MLRSDVQKVKSVSEQLKVSVIQGITQILGPDFSIIVTTNTVERTPLSPTGEKYDIRVSVEVYPKSPA